MMATLLSFLLLGSTVAAHLVSFSIWGYNTDIWAGTQNHYHNQWETSLYAWDFEIPIDTQVRQEAASSFYWQALRTGPGYDWTGAGSAVKYTLWIWDQSGSQLYTSNAFQCDPVTYSGTLFPSPRIYNPSNSGTYEQWSGAGGGFCYDSYPSKDYYAVTSQ